jgi:hypothetical protein
VRLDEQLTSLEENVREHGCAQTRVNMCGEEADKVIALHKECKDTHTYHTTTTIAYSQDGS